MGMVWCSFKLGLINSTNQIIIIVIIERGVDEWGWSGVARGGFLFLLSLQDSPQGRQTSSCGNFLAALAIPVREAIAGEKWCFFEHCSKGLWPPPPFIWTFVLFCRGYFLNAFLSIKNGSNNEKNIFGGINCRGRAPLNQRSFERCSKKFGHCSKICAMFKNSLFVYDGVP